MADIRLGLDLAAKSGVVWGQPFEAPEFAVWDLRAPRLGQRGFNLMQRLTPLVDHLKPRGLSKAYIETPLDAHVAAKMGAIQETTISLNGYVFLAMTILDTLGIEYALVDRQKALQHFVGQPRFKNKDDGKRACVVRCKQLGWGDVSFDEADAAALWDCGCARDNPREFALHGVERAVQIRK
jgi:hypothetical protein